MQNILLYYQFMPCNNLLAQNPENVTKVEGSPSTLEFFKGADEGSLLLPISFIHPNLTVPLCQENPTDNFAPPCSTLVANRTSLLHPASLLVPRAV